MLPPRKGFTDFNDLATKSVRGKEGVERQARVVVDQTIAQQAEQGQQEWTQKQERRPRAVRT